ncbi:MAG: protein-L-isoaspartate(D-aspartate) O-methyltransferase [Deltaproteobacteria bacterium]|nr:protein-L-isoaspartate(D-aspartate) O-methyltransferase [Deltaproteobacteria bacterium]MBW2362947.1 protein-L-isoaspartate(D-aspartate) O-methyltransferase [Deltaproteobacteria bacterium]
MTGSRSSGGSGFVRARQRLLERLGAQGITDRRVLDAFRAVARHELIPEALQLRAYEDTSLPIGGGQTISAPGVVAAMTAALELTGSESVLEVGTGSGYQAAILARLASRVVSIERLPRLAAEARRSLDRLRVSNVVVHLGDGTAGRPSDAPFDAIIVTAGGPEIPQPLLDQLAVGGRLVGPFGAREEQSLYRVRCTGPLQFERERLGRCRFVDLVGAHGWAA